MGELIEKRSQAMAVEIGEHWSVGSLGKAPSIFIENDANLAGLAEYHANPSRASRVLLFVKVSAGVGAGLIIDREIFKGATGTAGEIGHVTAKRSDDICRCGGYGCLELYTSTECLTARAMSLGVKSNENAELTVADVARALQDHERPQQQARLAKVLEELGEELGAGIAHAINLLNPDRVAIGGEMLDVPSDCRDEWLDVYLGAVRRSVSSHVSQSAGASSVVIEESALQEDASLHGALRLGALSVPV